MKQICIIEHLIVIQVLTESLFKILENSIYLSTKVMSTFKIRQETGTLF